MSEIKVASRYAKSLLDLAKEQNAVEAVHQDMQVFYQTVKQHAELRAVLSNPIVSGKNKKAVLDQLFAAKFSKMTLSFFDIMIVKSRESLLYATAVEFFNQYNVFKGIVRAKVASATPLSDKVMKELCSIIETATQSQVQLENTVDSALIGGFVLTVGDRQFDASLSKGLNALRKELSANTYVSSI